MILLIDWVVSKIYLKDKKEPPTTAEGFLIFGAFCTLYEIEVLLVSNLKLSASTILLKY